MLVKLHKNKGITLIALIITVIVLLILAGVAVNMLVGEDGILSHTKTSTEKYSIEAEKEALRLEILNIQTEILKTQGRKATLEDLQARIDLAKYEIEMHYEPIATSTPVANPATYSIVKRIGTDYYFTVDNTLIITKVEEIKEEDSPISKFTIQLSNTTYKDTTVTLKEIPTSEAGTIEKYDYIAETTGNKIELTNITETTKKITGLTEQTTYKVYVIAYDNAGNKRKSNIVTITTPEYVPPQASNPQITWSNTGTPRAGRDLDLGTNYTVGEETVKYQLTWADMAQIAKAISNTRTDTDTTNDINSDVYEFNITYDGTTYLIGVGDRMRINGKVVRILGFNHDDLVDTGIYENADGKTNAKAGISFEYVDFITTSVYNSNTNKAGGWGESDVRGVLNTNANSQYNTLNTEIRNKIKKVEKEYYTAGIRKISNDYLWLLSATEVWGNKGYNSTLSAGYSTNKEGEQYKYYKNIILKCEKNNYLKKPYDMIGSSQNATRWWLRSNWANRADCSCYVGNDGSPVDSNSATVKYSCGIAPGFCI